MRKEARKNRGFKCLSRIKRGGKVASKAGRERLQNALLGRKLTVRNCQRWGEGGGITREKRVSDRHTGLEIGPFDGHPRNRTRGQRQQRFARCKKLLEKPVVVLSRQSWGK